MDRAPRRESPVDPGILAALSCGGSEDPAAIAETADLVYLFRVVRTMVCEAVDELPEMERTLINGFYWERLTYDELAYRCGFSHRSTALRATRRAEKMLRRRLEVNGCQTIWRRFCVDRARYRATSARI